MKQVFSVFWFFVLLAVSFFVGVHVLSDSPRPFATMGAVQVLGTFIRLYLGLLVSLFVLTLGFLVAATLTGMRIRYVELLGCRAFWYDSISPPPKKGQILVYATKANPSATSLAIFQFGGGLLCIALAVLLYLFVPFGGLSKDAWIIDGNFAFFVAMFSVFWALTNGYSAGVHFLDMPKLLEAHRSAHIYFEMFSRHPKEWTKQDIDGAFPALGFNMGALELHHYWWHLEQDRLLDAQKAIRTSFSLIDACLPGQQAQVAYEMSIFAARFERNKELSDYAFGEGLRIDSKSLARQDSEVAREVIWGDRAKAESLVFMILHQSKEESSKRRAYLEHMYARILSDDPPPLEPNPDLPAIPPKPLASQT